MRELKPELGNVQVEHDSCNSNGNVHSFDDDSTVLNGISGFLFVD